VGGEVVGRGGVAVVVVIVVVRVNPGAHLAHLDRDREGKSNIGRWHGGRFNRGVCG